MANAAKTTKIEDFTQNPSKHFDRAEDVLRRHSLTPEQKEKILESWKLDEKRLEESFNENMTGGEESRLGEVSSALEKLRQSHLYQNAGKLDGASTGLMIGGAAGAVFGMALLPLIGGRSTPLARGLGGALIAIAGAVAGSSLACLRNNLLNTSKKRAT